MTKVRALKRLPLANHLLAAVPRPEYQRLSSDLEAVTLRSGQVLYEPGRAIRHVYFPQDSLVSLLVQTEGHKALEIGVVGREGMLGIQLALGSHDSQVCARVQETGTALRMECAHLRLALARCVPLKRELYRYINEWMAQLTQNAACHRFHLVEARLARRLLITRDHTQSNVFQLTQELLAGMLGVLRVAVTNAAGALQRRRLIRYSRGEISILDGRGLEAAACACYRIGTPQDTPVARNASALAVTTPHTVAGPRQYARSVGCYDPPAMNADTRAPWKELLANPDPDAHIVQLYQDENFYGEAISHFAAEGIVKDESIILVATQPHWEIISRCLSNKGLDLGDLFNRRQLTVLDADVTLPKLMAGTMPDAAVFKALAGQTIENARAGGKFPRVRWWGEIVNVLYVNGNGAASNRLEELCDELAREHSVAIFCSFLMDKFDPCIYDEAFANICRTHRHVIPAADYASHSAAVNHAITEVIGEIKGPLLRSLMSWAGAPSMMPSSQAMLLWVKETMPFHFPEVLAQARRHEEASTSH